MLDHDSTPLTVRMSALVSRLAVQGGYIVAQADIAEGVARIVRLERALGGLLDHIDHVSYLDATGSRLSDATPAVETARALLEEEPTVKAARRWPATPPSAATG